MAERGPRVISSGREGERNPFPFFYKILDQRPMTPKAIVDIVNGLRHPDGRVNHKHPAIEDVMKEANKKKLNVGIVSKGLHAMVVWGKNLINETDKKKVAKVGARVIITTATISGVTMIALRMHRRSRREQKPQ